MRVLSVVGLLALLAPVHAQASWRTATGRVVDLDTGEPVVGARVILLECESVEEPASCRQNRYRPARTDRYGRFSLGAVVLSTYAVRVAHPGYAPVQMPPYIDEPSTGVPHYEIGLFAQPRGTGGGGLPDRASGS
ncbi:MAG: carboxypeptidase-like regulatory domain-containing protein [Bacteroidota bacterium]